MEKVVEVFLSQMFINQLVILNQNEKIDSII